MKKLLSLTIALLLISQTLLRTSAADLSRFKNEYRNVARELNEVGIIKGDAMGDFNELGKLTREEILVIISRLLGVEEEVKNWTGESGFIDVPKDHWAAKYIGYAKEKGWTTGINEKEFGLGQPLTAKQAMTMIIRAAGDEVDWKKHDVVGMAKQMNLLQNIKSSEDESIPRGDMFYLTQNAILNNRRFQTAPNASDEMAIVKRENDVKTATIAKGKNYVTPARNPLKEIFGETKKYVKQVPAVPEDAKGISYVEALNYHEILVTFKQSIDKKSIKDSYFAVVRRLEYIGYEKDLRKIQSMDILDVDVVSNETIRITTREKMDGKMSLIVDGVKSMVGTDFGRMLVDFSGADPYDVEIEQVKTQANTLILIEFSKPLEDLDFKVEFLDGAKINLSSEFKKGFGVNKRNKEVAVFLDPKTPLEPNKNYKIKLSHVSDRNKKIDLIKEFKTNANEDITARVVDATDTYVELQFSQKVFGIRPTHFYHTKPGFIPVAMYESKEQMEKDDTKSANLINPHSGYEKVVLRFVKAVEQYKPDSKDEHPLPLGYTTLHIGNGIYGGWKNYLKPQELQLYVPKFEEDLKIENIEVDGNKVEITFSDDVIFNPSDYQLSDQNNRMIPGARFVGNATNKTVNMEIFGVDVGTDHVLWIGKVKSGINQVRYHKPHSYSILWEDKEFKQIAQPTFMKSEDGKQIIIRIRYKEPVALNCGVGKVENYLIYNHFVPRQHSRFVNKDKVKIQYQGNHVYDYVIDAEEYDKLFNTKDIFYPLYIKISSEICDLAGNKPEKEIDMLVLPQNIGTRPSILSINLVEQDEIQVQFNKVMKSADGWLLADFNMNGFKDPFTKIIEEKNYMGTLLRFKLNDVAYDPIATISRFFIHHPEKISDSMGNVMYYSLEDKEKGYKINDKLSPKLEYLSETGEELRIMNFPREEYPPFEVDKPAAAFLPYDLSNYLYEFRILFSEPVKDFGDYELTQGLEYVRTEYYPDNHHISVIVKVNNADFENLGIKFLQPVMDYAGNYSKPLDEWIYVQPSLALPD